MDFIKKILGFVWVTAGLYAAYYLITVLAMPKFATGKPEDKIPAIIYLFLVPIVSLSLIIFGWYSVTNEYDEAGWSDASSKQESQGWSDIRIKMSLLGLVLGLPLSYYFQPEKTKLAVGLGDYISNMLSFSLSADVSRANIFVGMLVFSVVGYLVGTVLNKKK